MPVFEGPLDLLLYLIKQNKIDIYDIPIALITKQYLEYLEFMRELDLEIASEFLVMAATLIYIKSKMLLPRQESGNGELEEDPRQPLVTQLIEYEKFKQACEFLKERYQIWSQAFPRKTQSEDEVLINEISVFDLLTALKRLLQKPQPKVYIPTETIKVEDKMQELINRLRQKDVLSFDEVFEKDTSKLEVVVTFIALLELIKLKLVKAFQEKPFGKILLTLMEENNVSRNYLRYP